MTNQQEIQMEFLEKCVREYRIFIDTSSLLEESAEKFFQNIEPLLRKYNASLIVPLAVCDELEKLAKNENHQVNANVSEKAYQAFKKIVRLHDAKLVGIFADPDDGNFADNVFLHVFTKKRLQFNILLITQDHGLASEAMKLSIDNRAVKGMKKIIAQRLDKNGFLQRIFDSEEHKTPKTYVETEDSEEIPPNEKFNFAKEIVHIEGKMPVSMIPQERDYVIAVRNSQSRQIKLLEELGAGGEGAVYKTNLPGFVAKIYLQEKITRLRYEKLTLMLTKDINCEGICFPLAMLFNRRNEFVGYLMREASGKDLGKSVFLPMLLKKYFPKWTKVETVQLCITILQKIKYLHDRNIILGDINPYNILIESPTKVYFVDTDSYQVEGFICPVGTPLFTAPELQKNTSYGLRTLGNENFAVATLLFMIMHPGKSPYAMQDGGGIVENILAGDFSYPFGELKTGKVPQGPWRYCWSHLTYKIKEAFYHTFRIDGMYHDEKKRPGPGRWLRLFSYYLFELQSGRMTARDEESILIFPTRFKHEENKNYGKCKICGREFNEEQLEQGICRNCLNEGEKYYCTSCGCEMLYTNYQKYIKHAKRYKKCKNCFEKSNTIYARRTCKGCGKMFEITFGEKEYFENRNLTLPTRCEQCRGKTNVTVTKTFKPAPAPTPTPTPKKNTLCFITTAVCQYLGKLDDCFELTTLRNFRDNWLALQPGGRKEIQEYYKIAPEIVEKLAASDEKDLMYEKIRLEYIEPCLKDILQGNNENCRARYRKMVENLKQKFLIN